MCMVGRNPCQQITERIVESDADEDDGQITDIEIGIEPQRHAGQKEIGQLVLLIIIQSIPAQQYHGQKDEDEDV